MVDLSQLKKDIAPLITKCDTYLENKKYKKEDYQEDDIKTDLIEPLFIALGWDIGNKKGQKQVKEQRNQPQGRPDYIFYFLNTYHI